jgi:hypothetical protein
LEVDYWNYGWDMIQYVVDRNERRSYLDTMVGRKRRLGILSRYEAFEIVPKSLLAGSNEEGDTGDDSANDRSDNIISGTASTKSTNLEGTGTVVIYRNRRDPSSTAKKMFPLTRFFPPRSSNSSLIVLKYELVLLHVVPPLSS